MSLKLISLFVVILGCNSVNCWIINHIDLPELKRQLKMDLLDLENEIYDEDSSMQRFTLIYPGTKWCGAGNVADNYDDLGAEIEVDMCCRAHDYCPDVIMAGESKFNLTNDAFYTRLSCECDQQFQQCLRRVKRRVANNIGTVYFNALGTKCFRNDFPTSSCLKKGGWLKRKCLEHEYNTLEEKRYQWFDVIDY